MATDLGWGGGGGGGGEGSVFELELFGYVFCGPVPSFSQNYCVTVDTKY